MDYRVGVKLVSGAVLRMDLDTLVYNQPKVAAVIIVHNKVKKDIRNAYAEDAMAQEFLRQYLEKEELRLSILDLGT